MPLCRTRSLLPARTARNTPLCTVGPAPKHGRAPHHAPAAAACNTAPSVGPAPVEPQPCRLRPDGTVPNTASNSKVPPQLLPLLHATTQALANLYNASLIGVYLRGSAAQGRYIQGLSDVDIFLVHLHDPAAPASTLPAAEQHVQQSLLAQGFDPVVVSKLEVVPHPVPSNSCLGHLLKHLVAAGNHQVQSAVPALVTAGDSSGTTSSSSTSTSTSTSTGGSGARSLAMPASPPTWLLGELPCAFLLKSQAACLRGLNLPALLPPAAALPPPPDLDRLGAGIEAALTAAGRQQGAGSGAVRGLRWALKTCLREAGALTMPQRGLYSRDLFWCCQLAGHQLPHLKAALDRALELFLVLDPEAAGQVAVQEAVQEATEVVQQLRGRLYREGLRCMLTPEPDWLPRHHPQGASACPPPATTNRSPGLLQRLRSLGQLLVAPASSCSQEAAAGGLLAASAPVTSVRVAGQVDSFDWSNPDSQAEACRLIEQWSVPLDSVPSPEAAWQLLSSRPLVVRGAAAGWQAVQQWTVPWLAEQGFQGRVMVAPSLQFPFCEPGLAELLVQAKGTSGPPSTEVRMSVAEFVSRMRPGPRPPPLIYRAGEYYYMQAELSPQLLAMTQLDAAPFVAGVQAVRRASPGVDGTACNVPGRLVAQVPRLWLSCGGSVSPLHYDESHSFLVQVQGTKRMLFWPPSDLAFLYPYPSGHLLRRRSRINLARPNLQRFPLFGQAAALEVVLQPGDVVYFPARWAHHTESLTSSVSMTCRYRSGTEATGSGPSIE